MTEPRRRLLRDRLASEGATSWRQEGEKGRRVRGAVSPPGAEEPSHSAVCRSRSLTVWQPHSVEELAC